MKPTPKRSDIHTAVSQAGLAIAIEPRLTAIQYKLIAPEIGKVAHRQGQGNSNISA
jgi:hypothetical protein